MSIVIIVLALLVAISVLVAVHEFGHYWVAKKLGFKVLRFSIGFGNQVGRPLFADAKTADPAEQHFAAGTSRLFAGG